MLNTTEQTTPFIMLIQLISLTIIFVIHVFHVIEFITFNATFIALGYPLSVKDDDTCHDPGVPENGWRDGNLPFVEDETFYFGCNEGYRLQGDSSLTCYNGQWSNGGWNYVYRAPECKGKSLLKS